MTKWDRPERFRRGRAITAFGAALAITLAPMQPAFAFQQETPAYRDAARSVPDRVEDLLSRMTLEEKVGQMQGLWENKGDVQTPEGDFSPERASAAFPHGLGQISRPSDMRGVDPSTNGAAGVTEGAVNRDGRQTVEYINAAQRWATEQTRLGIPLIFHEESLHGYTARGATSFPQSIALASTWDPELITRVFNVASREMRARGVHLTLAPVVDVARDPRWGRIEETYGEDPHLVSEMGLAVIRGYQGETLPLAQDRVFVTLKHMTGHGEPENGINVGPAQISERVLREVFFPPFERAVRELPVRSIMASYNEIDGLPSHANRWLLNDVLREEWGYDGLIVSDYFAIREMVTRHQMFANIQDATVRAMDAGVDIELPDGEGFTHLPALVAEGRVSEAQIDNAVRRILTMKFEAGLFENPYADPETADALTATPDAIALARQVAGRAITLLKNDNQTLPLRAQGLGRLAVLGTHAVDTPIGGYSDIPRHVVSVLEGLEAEAEQGGFEVVYSEGVRLTESREWAADDVDLVDPAVNARLIEEAVAVARQSDVIVMVLGENEQLSREAWAESHLGDRADLQLVGQQMDLARAIFALNKPTIVLLLNGRPLAVGELVEQADALIQGWYLGQETGNAVADVLFGRVNPGGKLPVTIPRSVGQLPVFYNHKPTARRGYLFDETSPLFPFGYGLSYTSFRMSAPRLTSPTIRVGEAAQVQVDVTNTGRVAGDEVVQIYVRDDHASITRPVLELKAFERVTLQPGETRTVTLDLSPEALSLWDLNMQRVVEPGTFTIHAGPNSVDLQSATLTVR
ncbi:glycoside hydrolase family 3 N-terminal domain-containing protein [Brevundimonas sp.]|uniref:glycoside hydrolase family 3 N-terminal domain-containing protein n=1 Tax=Brevundimonas sp. TaxID=1871086 RepID=UPI003918B19E